MRLRRRNRLTLEKILAHLSPSPALPAGLLLTLPRPGQHDLIYFPDPDKDVWSQPPNQLLVEFATHGHRVFQVQPQLNILADTPNMHPTELNPLIYTLQLPAYNYSHSTQADLDESKLAIYRQSFKNLRRIHSMIGVVCLVRSSCWSRLTQALEVDYGWKIIEDNSNDIGFFPTDYHTLSTTIRNLYGRASIIIISYNNLNYTRQCLESILAKTIYPNYEVIVVDNNSQPDVKTYLAEMSRQHPRIKVIFNEQNMGFAAANNIGLRQCPDSEFVVLLNNDVVVSRGWLISLLKHLQDPEIGMVGPVTNWTGNEARIEVNYHQPKDMEPFAEAYTQAHEGQIFDIKMLAMYCVAMRRVAVDEVGPLDEQFGIGMFEDEDYAIRVRQTGRRVICAEDVFVHHYGMASFSKLKDEEYQRLFERNKQIYEAKWGKWVPHQAR